MPEIGLGIGCERGNYGGVVREWLYWYDEGRKRYSTPNERISWRISFGSWVSILMSKSAVAGGYGGGFVVWFDVGA
jgi:hypothetical protein